MSDAAERLVAAGMSPEVAAAKTARYANCDVALDAVGATGARKSLWVPGRIEVLGKHTDYAGGNSLVAAVERGFSVRFAARRDATVRVLDVVRNEQCSTSLAVHGTGRQGEWSNYVATVGRRIARDFPRARTGADIAIASDLPSAAGLSSSSALIVAVALVLFDVNAIPAGDEYRALFPSTEDLASYFGAVESGAAYGALRGDTGVGTFGGSEDHVAVMCSEPAHISGFSFCPARRTGVYPIPAGHTFVIGVSGVAANKSGAARERYNSMSLSVSHLLAAWNRFTGREDATLSAAIDSSGDARERLRHVAAQAQDDRFSVELLARRLDHLLEESHRIVPAAADALRRGNLEEFGGLVDESQHAAEALLGNQVAETVSLQRLARGQGARAASAFGAGFGGSVWALVPSEGAPEFITRWSQVYRESHSGRASRSNFFASGAGPPAILW